MGSIQCFRYGELKRRQIILYGIPYCRDIEPVILVAQPVPNPSNITPGLSGANNLCRVAQANRRFANQLQLSLHSGEGLWVRSKSLQVHAQGKLLDQSNAVEDVLQRKAGSLEDKDSLVGGPFCDGLLEHRGWGQIYRSPQKF